MKETIRTASVLEIYNASIKELEEQRKNLSRQLALKKAASAGKTARNIIVYLVLGFLGLLILIVIPLALSNTGTGQQDNQGSAVIIFIIAGLAIWGLVSFARHNRGNKDGDNIETGSIIQNIQRLDDQIHEKELRVKSLLNAEEVIVAKDMKVALQDVDVEPFSQNTVNTELGKVCPMCAETVKKAAKVCRYCGNKFE